jgi:hypothetical protein
MTHKWTIIPLLVVLANIIIVGSIKSYIGVLTIKLIIKIMAHYNLINIGLLTTKIHTLLVTMGISDAYLVAFETF